MLGCTVSYLSNCVLQRGTKLITLCISIHTWTLVLIIHLNQFITPEPLDASLDLQIQPSPPRIALLQRKPQYVHLVNPIVFHM